MELTISTQYQRRGIGNLALALGQVAILGWLHGLATRALLKLAASHLPAAWSTPGWPNGYLVHLSLLLAGLALIAVLRPFVASDFGLRLPRRGASYLWPALWIGALSGVVMLVADHFPELLAGHAPQGPYSTAPSNMVPWLLMQGLFVGPSEELPFRSLLQVFLISRIPYRVRCGRYEVSLAAIVVAVGFALAHADAFAYQPFAAALAQQIYAIALGIFYGYLIERSGSLLAPAIAHNAGDFVEWGLRFALQPVMG